MNKESINIPNSNIIYNKKISNDDYLDKKEEIVINIKVKEDMTIKTEAEAAMKIIKMTKIKLTIENMIKTRKS